MRCLAADVSKEGVNCAGVLKSNGVSQGKVMVGPGGMNVGDSVVAAPDLEAGGLKIGESGHEFGWDRTCEDKHNKILSVEMSSMV